MNKSLQILAGTLLCLCTLGRVLELFEATSIIMEYGILFTLQSIIILAYRVCLIASLIVLIIGVFSRKITAVTFGCILFIVSKVIYLIFALLDITFSFGEDPLSLCLSVATPLSAVILVISTVSQLARKPLGIVATVAFTLIFIGTVLPNFEAVADYIYLSDFTIDTVLYSIRWISSLLVPLGFALLALNIALSGPSTSDASNLSAEKPLQPASYPWNPENVDQASASTISLEEFQTYAQLLASGALTPDEFAAIKRQFLNQ